MGERRVHRAGLTNLNTGNLVLVIVGVLLIAGSAITSVVNSQHLSGEFTSCNNAAHYQYQQQQASNPYPPGSTQWTVYNDQVTAIYQEELAACQNNYNDNSQSANSETSLWFLIGAIVLGIGLYRWHGEPPKTTAVPAGAAQPPSQSEGTPIGPK